MTLNLSFLLLFELADVFTQCVKLGGNLAKARRDETLASLESLGDTLDIEVEAAIFDELRSSLGVRLAGIEVIGEESTGCSTGSIPPLCILIDPIDGTASLRQGYETYVCQISYLQNGVPLVGAVFAPETNELWTCVDGFPLMKDGLPLVQRRASTQVDIIDNSPQPNALIEGLINAGVASGYIESGSLGLKLCRVAEGSAQLFVKDVSMYAWDVAPGALFLKASGCIFASLRHRNFINEFNQLPYSEGIVACSEMEMLHDVWDQCGSD